MAATTKAGVPKVPAKDRHGLKISSSNKDDLDNDQIVCVGATKLALLHNKEICL
jgi:hypothetical protein